MHLSRETTYVNLSFSGNPFVDTSSGGCLLLKRPSNYSVDWMRSWWLLLACHLLVCIHLSKTSRHRWKSSFWWVFCLSFIVQDSTEKPFKIPSYIFTWFPIDGDSSLAKEHSGVYSVCRVLQDASPIKCITVAWSLPKPPPSEISFNFRPYLPPYELRKLHYDHLWCYRC